MKTELRTLTVLAAIVSLTACADNTPVGLGADATAAFSKGGSTSAKSGNAQETKLRIALTAAADAAAPAPKGSAKFEAKGNERQLEIEVERVAPGTDVIFLLGGAAIGTGKANALGEALLELRGAAAPATVAGLTVAVTTAAKVPLVSGTF